MEQKFHGEGRGGSRTVWGQPPDSLSPLRLRNMFPKGNSLCHGLLSLRRGPGKVPVLFV